MAPFLPDTWGGASALAARGHDGSFTQAAGALMAREPGTGLPMEQCENTPDWMVVTGGDAGTSTGGVAFCASKHGEGLMIKEISAQADANALRGMQITFSDDQQLSFGENFSTEGREGTISWDPTVDTISSIELWDGSPNGNDQNSLSRIIIELSNGNKLDAGSNKAKGVAKTTIDVGKSGLLTGMRGRHGGSEKENGGSGGGNIDQLEFFFAKSAVKDKRVDNLKFSPSPEEVNSLGSNEERGFEVERLDTMVYHNQVSNPVALMYEVKKTTTSTQSWTESLSNTFGMSLGFEVSSQWGIPELASTTVTMSTEMHWEIKKEKSSTTEKSEETALTFQQKPTVPPGKAYRCSTWTFKGKTIDISYSGEAVLALQDGGEIRYPVSGAYDNVMYTKAQGDCVEIDPKDVNTEKSKGAREPTDDEIVQKS